MGPGILVGLGFDVAVLIVIKIFFQDIFTI